MSEENQKNKNDEGWPIRLPTLKTTPYWVKCWIVCIALLLAFTIIPALVFGLIYLSSDILSAYSKGEESKDIRSTILMLTALLGVSGIPLFIWRTNIAQSQAETARDRAYTELFTKAIEQLGAEKPKKEDVLDENGKPVKDNAGQTIMKEIYVPNIEVRIGAIFALERIMKDSEKDAASVVDTLAAYVRENCGKPTLVCEIPEEENFESTHEWVSAIKDYVGDIWSPGEGSLVARARALRDQPQVNRADINTALTVIGRRPDWLKDPEKFKSQTPEMPDLQNVNFQGWDLRKFDLSWCNLSGANMQGADIVLAQIQGANMSGAEMQGSIMQDAEMQGADMSHAKMQGSDMAHAEMKGANMLHAQMQGANISRAKMQEAGMESAQMQGADVRGTELQGANMHWANMQAANMSGAQMQSAIMRGAVMQGSDIAHAKMQGSNMRYALMKGAEMRGTELQGADMQGTELQGANMQGTELQGADMKHAKMQGADMAHANMQEAILQGAVMQGANMQDAQIEEVKITSARKTAASVIWVDFTKSKFEFDKLQEQLPEMFGHKEETTLPKGMAIPEHWSEAVMGTEEGNKQYAREWEAFKKKMGVE